MRGYVVYGYKRLLPAIRVCFGGSYTDKQRPDKSRAGGYSNSVNIPRYNAGLLQCLLHKQMNGFQMPSRRNFRHHSGKAAVKIVL